MSPRRSRRRSCSGCLAKGVLFVNIFDELHNAGKDDLLRVRWATPAALEFDPVFDLIAWDWDETVKWSLDLLNG